MPDPGPLGSLGSVDILGTKNSLLPGLAGHRISVQRTAGIGAN